MRSDPPVAIGSKNPRHVTGSTRRVGTRTRSRGISGCLPNGSLPSPEESPRAGEGGMRAASIVSRAIQESINLNWPRLNFGLPPEAATHDRRAAPPPRSGGGSDPAEVAELLRVLQPGRSARPHATLVVPAPADTRPAITRVISSAVAAPEALRRSEAKRTVEVACTASWRKRISSRSFGGTPRIRPIAIAATGIVKRAIRRPLSSPLRQLW
jgi:hypothetical protein